MLKELLNEYYEIIKNENSSLEKAAMLVRILFKDKYDKGNLPYIDHLLTVSSSVSTEKQKVAALLHDVIEDINVPEEELIEIGFSKEVVDIVVILTRKSKPKEDYNDYIERIINSEIKDALEIKLADLKHNMDISRIKNPTVKDFDRVEKRYRPNYIKIQNKLNEMRK